MQPEKWLVSSLTRQPALSYELQRDVCAARSDDLLFSIFVFIQLPNILSRGTSQLTR